MVTDGGSGPSWANSQRRCPTEITAQPHRHRHGPARTGMSSITWAPGTPAGNWRPAEAAQPTAPRGCPGHRAPLTPALGTGRRVPDYTQETLAHEHTFTLHANTLQAFSGAGALKVRIFAGNPGLRGT